MCGEDGDGEMTDPSRTMSAPRRVDAMALVLNGCSGCMCVSTVTYDTNVVLHTIYVDLCVRECVSVSVGVRVGG